MIADNQNKKTIGIVMDPISEINPKKDTSLALLLSAQKLGAKIIYFEQDDLFIQKTQTYGMGRPLTVKDNSDDWYDLGERSEYNLKDLDLVLMRKDPPVDKRFIHTTYMLEKANTRVENDPKVLRDYNEKLLALEFPEHIPETVVSSDYDVLKRFLNTQDKIILKPLDAMGGSGIFMISKDDVNFDVIWEIHTDNGKYPIIAQEFIPQIDEGDKRVLILNDEIFEYMMVRLPKEGSVRGNLAAGASHEIRKITDTEREIAEATLPFLDNLGLSFVGLDIIGNKLIEVNTTSPTGMRHIAAESPENPSDIYMHGLLFGT